MTTLRELSTTIQNKLFLGTLAKSAEKQIESCLPVPLLILKSKLNCKEEKKKYMYYTILVEQLFLSKTLYKYINSYLFAYDFDDFNLDYALIKLKEKIIKEDIVCDEIVTDVIFKEIEKLNYK